MFENSSSQSPTSFHMDRNCALGKTIELPPGSCWLDHLLIDYHSDDIPSQMSKG